MQFASAKKFDRKSGGSPTIAFRTTTHRSRVPHTPGFPVKFGGVGKPHAAFLNESRTRYRCLGPRTGNPDISLVFCKMWDTATLHIPRPRFNEIFTENLFAAYPKRQPQLAALTPQ